MVRINLQNKTMRQLMLGSLVLLLLVLLMDASNAFARGRKGGGAAGALDDFDLFLQMQATNGLPVNLINGLESANAISGDGTSGVNGTFAFDPNPIFVNSQGGDSVLLLPTLVNGVNKTRAGMARKMGPDGLPAMLSLKSVAIPTTPELNKFIRNKQAAILLGKALFWDAQAGSDGNACASCHFHAGADNRMTNSLAPALRGNDTTFYPTKTGAGGPNYKLKAEDFPFHRLANPQDRNSAVTYDTNNIASSQGSFGGAFQQLGPNGKEICGARPEEDGFKVGNVMTRRVPPRNTPSTINAVFNYRNFWDGRANNSFNGVSPFGPRDPDAKVLQKQPDGSTTWVKIDLRNASLASQAVGPALSDFEMSCANRTFKDLARKMLAPTLKPLGLQKVNAADSVLGGTNVAAGGFGLNKKYSQLIEDAFDPQWWNSTEQFDGYSQKEANFSLYWGLAIMMYESTLVSDETPFDKLVGDVAHPSNPAAMTASQLRGLGLFRGKGECLGCHKGAEFTGAATSLQPDQEGSVVEGMLLNTGELGVYDNGFYNIGVRPAAEDVGAGGKDPFGNPLSFTRTWFNQLRSRHVSDPVWIDPCMFSIFFDATACWTPPDPKTSRVVADGTFKTPSLRNIALTQPYFHNGSRFTLEQVVEFYNRGGDRRGHDDDDSSGLSGDAEDNGGKTNMHPGIKKLGLSPSEIADLVDFLRHGLTDSRVACDQAPFDHPSLKLHNGHDGDTNTVKPADAAHPYLAKDLYVELPAVGKNGLPKAECALGDDGSRMVVVPPPVNPPPVNPPPVVVTPPVNPTPVKPPPVVVTAPVNPPSVLLATQQKPKVTLATQNGSAFGFTILNGSTSGVSGFNSTFNDDSASSKGNSRSSGRRGAVTINAGGFNNSESRSQEVEERRGEVLQPQEAEHVELVPPSATLNLPEEVLVKSRVTMYGAVSSGNVFSWTQLEGPAIELSGADTLAPSFNAPDKPTTLVFELTASDADGNTIKASSVIKVVTDKVEVHQVAWMKSQDGGKLNVVASSSAIIADSPLPPPDMTMIASVWSKTIPAGKLGSASKPLELPMTYVRNLPGKPAVCKDELPCFSMVAVDGIPDPKGSPQAPKFLPPTHVMIKSSFGGIFIAKGAEIHLR